MLNPDKNLYSVAPVGTVIVIGRQIALRGGLTRECAMNLLTWLIIATNARLEEIGALLKDALNGDVMGGPKSLQEFIGTIDREEQDAIDAASAKIEKAKLQLANETAIKVVDEAVKTLKDLGFEVTAPNFSK